MSKPDITLIATLKGGARKTTTAMFLAFAWAQRGDLGEVLVIDADPGTQGVTEWASTVYANGGELPFHVAQWSHRLGLLVPFAQQQARETAASRVLIDVGGEAPGDLRQAALIAARVISPVGPEQAELSRVAPTRTAVQASGRVPMHVLLTRVPQPGRGAAAEAREMLSAEGHAVMTAEIRQDRDVYAHVFGQTITNLGDYANASAEVLAL